MSFYYVTIRNFQGGSRGLDYRRQFGAYILILSSVTEATRSHYHEDEDSLTPGHFQEISYILYVFFYCVCVIARVSPQSLSPQ